MVIVRSRACCTWCGLKRMQSDSSDRRSRLPKDVYWAGQGVCSMFASSLTLYHVISPNDDADACVTPSVGASVVVHLALVRTRPGTGAPLRVVAVESYCASVLDVDQRWPRQPMVAHCDLATSNGWLARAEHTDAQHGGANYSFTQSMSARRCESFATRAAQGQMPCCWQQQEAATAA